MLLYFAMERPRVYLAGSMAAGRDFEDVLRQVSASLESLGCEIMTKQNVVENEKILGSPKAKQDRQAIMTRDKRWIQECDLFIAEVSQYSHGVGYEHCWAEVNGKPVLLLRHSSLKDQSYSAFLDGTDHEEFDFTFYDEFIIPVFIEKILIELANKTVKMRYK